VKGHLGAVWQLTDDGIYFAAEQMLTTCLLATRQPLSVMQYGPYLGNLAAAIAGHSIDVIESQKKNYAWVLFGECLDWFPETNCRDAC
jgi:hypothetical protein